MKRIILISCFILLSAGMVYAMLVPVSIVNPNFESDMAGWDIYPIGCTVEWSSDTLIDPGKVFVSCGSGFGWLQQNITITSPGVYTFSTWVSSTVNAEVIIDYMIEGGSIESINLCPPSELMQCSVSMTVPSGINEIQLFFGINTERSGGEGTAAFDAAELNYEPSVPPAVHSVTIPLSSGNEFILDYTWTFGEMAITALLAIVVVVFCARWMYDVAIQLWSMRGDNDSI